jgi:hypothetical protein
MTSVPCKPCRGRGTIGRYQFQCANCNGTGRAWAWYAPLPWWLWAVVAVVATVSAVGAILAVVA